MTELLNIIILACQIHSGGNDPFTDMHIQRECQRHLLKCISSKSKQFSPIDVMDCLKDTESGK